MPFESSSQRLFSTPARPMRSIAAYTRSRSPRSGTPFKRAMNVR